MADELKYSGADPDKILTLESRKMELDSGLLGRLFGSERNAPMNICGLVGTLLVASGVIVLFVPGTLQVVEYWKVIAPIVTAILGFMFGRRT